MENNLSNLILYRMQRSAEDYDAAIVLFENKKYLATANRLYYAVFHISTALLIADGFHTKTHSGFITTFGQHYVLTRIFDKSLAKTLQMLEKNRTKSDYDDFFELDKDTATELINLTNDFCSQIKKYILTKHPHFNQ